MDVLPVFMIRSTSVADRLSMWVCWVIWEVLVNTVADAASFVGEVEFAVVVDVAQGV
jgi:hypothetical protein